MCPFDINSIPKDKPNDFSKLVLEDGIHEVTIEKVEYKQSNSGNWMLSIQLKADNGKFIFDQIMDDESKPMNGYKLGRLLEALKITVKGAVELRDMTKIIKPHSRIRASVVNKGEYVNIDLNKGNGYYPLDDSATATPATADKPNTPPTLDAVSDDDSF